MPIDPKKNQKVPIGATYFFPRPRFIPQTSPILNDPKRSSIGAVAILEKIKVNGELLGTYRNFSYCNYMDQRIWLIRHWSIGTWYILHWYGIWLHPKEWLKSPSNLGFRSQVSRKGRWGTSSWYLNQCSHAAVRTGHSHQCPVQLWVKVSAGPFWKLLRPDCHLVPMCADYIKFDSPSFHLCWWSFFQIQSALSF